MIATASPLATSPLIDRLVDALGYPLLTQQTLPAFLVANSNPVLFFTEDPKRFPESNDVAVALPELAMAFPDLTPAVIAREDEKKLQRQFGFSSWPALVFLRGDQYLGVITGIQDWQVYLDEIRSLLAGAPSRPPTLGIPVKVQ